jgi:Tol biopolymer transport system component
MIRRILLLLSLLAPLALAADGKRAPTIDDLLNVRSIAGVRISPDGKWIAYGVSSTDFKQDAFVTQMWLVDTSSGRSFQLTRGEKSANDPQWSPDSQWLAFTSNRQGDKNQIFAIRPDGGEAIQLTKSESGVNGFSWSRDGKQIAFNGTEPQPQVSKDRKEHLGDYDVVRREYNFAQLWTLDVAEALQAPVSGTQRTKGKAFDVQGFSWSPDGSRIAFAASLNPDLINRVTSDIYVITLADNSVKKVVSLPGPDFSPEWSPDGKQLAFVTAMGRPDFFSSNSRIAVIDANGGTATALSESFDEQPNLITWNSGGIYFGSLQKTASHLFRLDPSTRKSRESPLLTTSCLAEPHLRQTGKRSPLQRLPRHP